MPTQNTKVVRMTPEAYDAIHEVARAMIIRRRARAAEVRRENPDDILYTGCTISEAILIACRAFAEQQETLAQGEHDKAVQKYG